MTTPGGQRALLAVRARGAPADCPQRHPHRWQLLPERQQPAPWCSVDSYRVEVTAEAILRTMARAVRRHVDSPRTSLAGHARLYRHHRREVWARAHDGGYAQIDAARHHTPGFVTFLSDDVTIDDYDYQVTVEASVPTGLADALVRAADAAAAAELATPLYSVADRLARRLRGYTPTDVWNLDTWIVTTLAASLDAHAGHLPLADHRAADLHRIATRLRLFPDSVDDVALPRAGRWTPTPLRALADEGFNRLIDHFRDYCDDGALLHNWSAQAAAALLDLAAGLHGCPAAYVDPVTDDVEAACHRWAEDLTCASDQLTCYHRCGDPDCAVAALGWIRAHLGSLWD